MMLFSLLCLAMPLAAVELPDAEAVQAQQIVRVPVYTEGIVFDHAGNAYISSGKIIYRLQFDGPGKAKAEKWAEPGGPNGHKILGDGTHLICDNHHKAVLHLDAHGKLLAKAAAECAGKPLRAPNDLCLDPQGGFYFTDPGDSSKDKPIGTVHYVDARGKVHLAVGGLAYPNGIVLRSDGNTLLVDDSEANCVYAFGVMAPGKLGPKQVFARLPAREGEQTDNKPDGMCLDEAGNLYVAHYGMRQVQVIGPDGKLLRRYPGGNLTTSNVAFGGPNMDQLYVTGALGKYGESEGALFVIDLKGVRGLTILPPKAHSDGK